MHDWQAFGQAAGGIVAYGILVKVLDFVRIMRESGKDKCHVGEGGSRDLHAKLDALTRAVESLRAEVRGKRPK